MSTHLSKEVRHDEVIEDRTLRAFGDSIPIGSRSPTAIPPGEIVPITEQRLVVEKENKDMEVLSLNKYRSINIQTQSVFTYIDKT